MLSISFKINICNSIVMECSYLVKNYRIDVFLILSEKEFRIYTIINTRS